jgi:V8-like Glu-specific endopeptidase
MARRRRHLLTLVLSALLVAVPMSAAAAAPAEDPCLDRPPTALDQRSDWRCVGLATAAASTAVPVMGDLTEEEARRLDVTRPANWELGVAVSPDGRLYRQVTLSPPGLAETRSYNPNPPDVDPEGEANPETQPVGVNGVFGADNRVIRTSTTAYPWRAMGAVMAPGATTSNCSGSLIGPRHLLTAGHCIHQGGSGKDKGWFLNRKVAPGQKGIGVFPNGVKNHAWYFSVVGWFDNADPAYDYGMIVLEDRYDTAHLGWLGWRSSGYTGGHWTFGYPGWSHTCAASPNNPKLCNNYLYGDDNSSAFVFSRQISTRADAQTGQSGSPIYKYNGGDRRVVAVLAYGGSLYNWGTKVTNARSSNFCDWIHAFPSAYNNHGCE